MSEKGTIITKLIRAITLYDKIANSEIVPSKIKYKNMVYLYLPCMHDYLRDDNSVYLFDKLINLNDWVEILEDKLQDVNIAYQGSPNSIRKSIGLPLKEEKKIEPINENLDYLEDIPFSATLSKRFTHNELVIINKLNELIEKVNGE